MPEWHRLIRKAFDLNDGESLNGLSALDIACGTGEISRVLTGLDAEVTAVDFSETMPGIARGKLAGRRWTGMLADAEALHPLKDGEFDLAVTRHLAWTLTDPLAAYAEWRRVLKAGGRLLVVDGNWSAPRSLPQRLRNWLADRMGPSGHSGTDRARHDDIRARLHYATGLTAERLEQDLRDVGFKSVIPLSVDRLYDRGMRGATFHGRLRQTSEHRFALMAV